MSNGLERLKAEGSQKIYETTHISRKSIEAIFDATYEGITEVQLNGFLSILEREYRVDLSAVKADYVLRQKTVDEKEEPFQVTAVSEHPKQKSGLIIAAIVGVVVIVFLIQFLGSDATTAEEETKAGPVVEEVVTDELNSSDANVSGKEEIAAVIAPEPVLPYQLVIEPKANLWMGYIDLETLKRYTKLTENSIELDPEKGWLLVFGHGFFKVLIGDEVMDLSAKGKVRMIYEEGRVREIDVAEFKERNRGQNW